MFLVIFSMQVWQISDVSKPWGLKSNTFSGSTHLQLPSFLNSDMCLHAYDARGRWRHLMAKWCAMEESRMPKAIPSPMTAKLRNNPTLPSTVYIIWGRVTKFEQGDYLFSESRGVHMIVQFEGNTVCSWAAWSKPNGRCVQAYWWWLMAAWLWKLSRQNCQKRQCLFFLYLLEPHERSCASTPWTSMQKKKKK